MVVELAPQVRRVVLCELAQPIGGAQTGVHAYVALQHARGDHLDVLARLPSGDWLRMWASLSQCRRLRIKTLPRQHPLYHDERVCDRDPERLATELAAAAKCARGVGSPTETDD